MTGQLFRYPELGGNEILKWEKNFKIVFPTVFFQWQNQGSENLKNKKQLYISL